MAWRSIFKGMVFVVILAFSIGYALDAGLADSMPDQNCRGGAIPCTKQCGPTIIDSYRANGVNYVVISESAEINLLAGKSTQYDSSCQLGFKAISGGYKLIEDGTTIDLDEIKINGTWAATDANTGLSEWNVWIYRDKGGKPDNCLNMEVHSICMQAQ